MYSFTFFVLAGLIAVVYSEGDDCMKFNPHNFHCCKKLPVMPDKADLEDAKECFKGPPNTQACEAHICVAKKHGYGNDDGTFNKELIEAYFEKQMASQPELLAAIKKNCINGDLSKYAPDKNCDVHTVQHCMHFQILAACPEWDNEGPCNGVKEMVEKCSKN